MSIKSDLSGLGAVHRSFVYAIVGLMLAVLVGILMVVNLLLVLIVRTVLGWL